MSDEVGTGRRYVEQQYGDGRNLAARQSIYSYQRPRVDLYNGSLDLAELRGDEAVLDIGCGNGGYLATLQTRGHRGFVCGADMSEGILRDARQVFAAGSLLVTDAQALPFATDAFDVVLSMHMLYHVPDRAKAIAEIRRVVRPGGVALVLTNSEVHFRELDELFRECARAAPGAEWEQGRASITRFKAETAAPELETVFTDVTAHAFAADLVIDAVEPVMAYARSMGAFVVDSEHALDPVLGELERRLAETIAADGAFRVSSACACFVCR